MLHIKPVESSEEWEMAADIRRRVFIEEQACPPEEEWDDHDAASRQLIGLVDGDPVATARWRSCMHEHRMAAKLERFSVLPEHRGRGYGRELVAFTIRDACVAGFRTQLIHAQAHLQRFYESMGFEVEGELFIEAGIPHVMMVRKG